MKKKNYGKPLNLRFSLADMWSVGVICYTSLSGYYPFICDVSSCRHVVSGSDLLHPALGLLSLYGRHRFRDFLQHLQVSGSLFLQ